MKRVALLGMPNTGKSTFFNRLTGAHARVGNWPGVTVELLTSKLLVGNQIVQLVDLPGIYDLDGYSDDEKVVTQFLQHQPTDLLILVLNATQLDRQMAILAQIMARNIPCMVVFNMADEAKAMGITIDAKEMSQALGLPICLVSAKYGQGMEHVQSTLRHALDNPSSVLERDVREHTDHLESVFKRCVQVPQQASFKLTEKIDQVLLHPWLGLPIFFAVMLLLFEGVFAVGKPLQDAMAWLFTEFRELALDPLAATWPAAVQGLLLDGVYNGLGTVASFVPLIVLFFLFMGVVEDTGYLSRAAFLMDALMARLGLDGRGFVMLLMGFGCNVPAIMGTRVIRSRELRWLTMLTIPFSLCSARLQVFVFFTAALFTTAQAPWVLFSLYLISLLSAFGTSLLFKRQYTCHEPFVLEMPPYRLPTARQIVLRGWQEVRHFLTRATRFIVLGVVLVWALTNLPVGVEPGSAESWASLVGQALHPVLAPLGIDPQLTLTLLFGFVAKEVVIGSLAVIYGQEGAQLVQTISQQITWVQAYSFMLFALIYTPCLSTIATIRHESKSNAFTALAVAWPIALAWGVSFAFYQAATRWF